VQALSIVANVSKVDDVDSMVKQALDKFGRIDVLVNVAGGTYSRNPEMPQFSWAPLLNLDEQDFMTAFDANVKTASCARRQSCRI